MRYLSDAFELFWAINLVGSMGQSCSWLIKIGLFVPRHPDVKVKVGSPHQSCMTMRRMIQRSPGPGSKEKPPYQAQCHF